MPEKILLIGPVNGRISELVSKVGAIEPKHGPFAALFVLGDLFHPDPPDSLLSQQTDLLQGSVTLPISTYFYQGTKPLSPTLQHIITQDNGDAENDVPKGLAKVAKNLYYAQGKSGVFVLPSGFRVAFVGGKWDPQAFAEANEGLEAFDPEAWHETSMQHLQDESLPYITPATINRLLAHPSFRLPSTPSSSALPSATRNGTKQGTLAAARAAAEKESLEANAQTSALELLTSRPALDLLLTNTWPAGVTLFSTAPNTSHPLGGLPDATARMWGSPLITRLVSCACSRYHFSLAPSESSSDLPVGISSETVEMGAFWERAPYVTDMSAYLPQPLPDTPQGRRQRDSLKCVTRFVSLAKFANEKKRRWFLALNLTPVDSQTEAVPVPRNATQTPYFLPSTQRSDGVKRAATGEALEDGANYRFAESTRAKRQRADGSDDVPPPGYVCRICGVEGHYIRLCPNKSGKQGAATRANNVAMDGQEPEKEKKSWTKSTMPLPAGLPSKPTFATHQNAPKRQLIPVGPSNCWFCLSNPSVAKSLIVTIGSESYLVFPKGPFSHPTVNVIRFNAAHLLIVPLTHTSHLLPNAHPVIGKPEDKDEEEEKRRVRAEIEETKESVRRVWAKEDHVMLEWTLVRVKTSSRMTHMQTQLLALKSSVVEERNVTQKLDEALETLASSSNLNILRKTDDIEKYLIHGTGEGGQVDEDGYFCMSLHLSEGRKEWLVPLLVASRFPVQFVRTALANMLALAHLADWKTCLPPPEEDSEDLQRQHSAAFREILLKASS